MLEGKKVNLRFMEKENVALPLEWWNSLEFQGEYFPVLQKSKFQGAQCLVCHRFKLVLHSLEKIRQIARARMLMNCT